jgi:hypothetical protein
MLREPADASWADPTRLAAGTAGRSSPARNKLSYGNCFVTAAILVRLPFCSREIGLLVPARLHLPGKGAGPAFEDMLIKLRRKMIAARFSPTRPDQPAPEHLPAP